MSAGTLNLNIDITRKKAVYSQISQTEFLIPYFTFGDVLPIVLQLFRFEGIPNQFAKPEIAGMSIEFTFSDLTTVDVAGTAPFVTQMSWTPDTTGQKFLADVAFNTAGLSTWLSTAVSKPGILRIALIEGGNRTQIYQAQIDVRAGSANVGPVAAGSTPLSYERAVGTFAPKVHAAGDDEIWISAGGYKFRFYPDDDGRPHFDQIT